MGVTKSNLVIKFESMRRPVQKGLNTLIVAGLEFG